MILGNARFVLLGIALLSAAFTASARDIYVSPAGDDKQAGTTAAPLHTIAAASSVAVAGDTVYLMPGQYAEPIVPVASGTVNKPITYKSAGPAPAVISNVNYAVLVASKAYIVLDGINVNGGTPPPGSTVNTFVSIQNSNYITVRNCNFKYANGWAGIDVSGKYTADGKYWENVPKSAMLDGATSYVTIEDNTIDGVGDYAKPSGDVIQVAQGTVQHVLIQRNTISHGGHDLVEFDSDYGVLQDNTLNNSYADVVSGDTGYRSIELGGSYNIVQRNFMAHSRRGGGGYVAPIASIRGNQNVFRLNVLLDGITGGAGTWCGTGAASQVTNGRIYNNTFAELGGQAWDVWAYGGCTALQGFVFANNLVVNSRKNPGTLSGVSHGGTVFDTDLLFVPLPATGPAAQSVAKGNLFSPFGGAPAYVMFSGAGGGGRVPLSGAASSHPDIFTANKQGRPSFVSTSPAVAADFQLKGVSPGIGTGVFLTSVVGSGTSDRLTVQDSLYFSDGNGLVPGDAVQLQGNTQRVSIVSIDRGSNTLTLSSPLTFKAGQGVSLPYDGQAPDIGASVPVRPLPPKNVAISH